jgi:flagellar motor switch protein FliN/FliY
MVPEQGAVGAPSIPNEAALMLPRRLEEGGQGIDPWVARLPVELDVAIPVKQFRVRNLLALEPGQVVETQWSEGEDLSLVAKDAQLAWGEFEVVDTRLAVRVTRLA